MFLFKVNALRPAFPTKLWQVKGDANPATRVRPPPSPPPRPTRPLRFDHRNPEPGFLWPSRRIPES